MLFADLGAEVIRVDRPENQDQTSPHPVLQRGGYRAITLELKAATDVAAALAPIDSVEAPALP